MPKTEKHPRFVQITTSESTVTDVRDRSLFALDENGDVWAYTLFEPDFAEGESAVGWRPLRTERLPGRKPPHQLSHLDEKYGVFDARETEIMGPLSREDAEKI